MFLLPERDAYLSETETADLLGFSVAKLRDLRRRQRIGAAMIGRHVLHSGKHIRDFLRSCQGTVIQQNQQHRRQRVPTEHHGNTGNRDGCVAVA